MAINFPSTTGQATDGSFTYTDSTAGITWSWDGTSWSAGGVGSAITIKDEGVSLTTAASSLDFVGLGVTASGTTGDKTITISGGGGSSYTDTDVDTHLNTSTASTNEVLTWNGTDYTWGAPAGYTNSDVDTHLNQSTALTGQILKWNGSDYDWSSDINLAGSAQFDNLRVSGISTFSGNVNIGDDDRLRLGDSGDLLIYHNSSFSGSTKNLIDSEIGSDGLYIRATLGNIEFKLKNKAQNALKLIEDGGVELYYGLGLTSAKKLETTGGGIEVSGIGTFSGGIIAKGGVTDVHHIGASYQQYKDFTVTVAAKTAAHRYNGSGSGSGYLIDGQESPFLTLTPGVTYRFYQEDSSNSGHPLLFYLEADKTTPYTTNVTAVGNVGATGGRTEILVTEDTPSVLYYQCSAHGYMGNAVQTNSNVAAKLQTARTLELSGAITGSTTFDGSGNANINTTSAITLGTDTSGNYVATVAGTANEIEVTGSGSGGAAVTVGLPNDVTITGTMTAGTFSGSGASLTSLPAAQLTGTLPAIDGSALTNLPSGSSVSDETSSTSTFYPIFSDVTSGSATTKVSSTKLKFTPSTGNLEATQFTSLSDRSKKTNIRPIQNALDITKQLDGVRFDWKDNDKESLGVIAQDVEKVLPELVETSDDGTKSVAYQNMVAVLIEAVKEQQKQIDRQQELINQLMEG